MSDIRLNGVSPILPVADRDYGMRDGTGVDPDGNSIGIGASIID